MRFCWRRAETIKILSFHCLSSFNVCKKKRANSVSHFYLYKEREMQRGPVIYRKYKEEERGHCRETFLKHRFSLQPHVLHSHWHNLSFVRTQSLKGILIKMKKNNNMASSNLISIYEELQNCKTKSKGSLNPLCVSQDSFCGNNFTYWHSLVRVFLT